MTTCTHCDGSIYREPIVCPCCAGAFCASDCDRDWHALAASTAVALTEQAARMRDELKGLRLQLEDREATIRKLVDLIGRANLPTYRDALLVTGARMQAGQYLKTVDGRAVWVDGPRRWPEAIG